MSYAYDILVVFLFSVIQSGNIYLSKVKDRNGRKMCEICSKLTINTQERRHWRHSVEFVVYFD